MINQPLKRGEKCYWKTGDTYSLAYFQSLNQMPIAPHAVKIKHRGEEIIVRDYEVETAQEKFEQEYAEELEFIIHNEGGRGFKKKAADALNVPYSRILMVCKKATKFGITLYEQKTQTLPQ